MKYQIVLGITLLLSVSFGVSYAIDAGPQVPGGLNTISQYCSNGTCTTGGTPSIPLNYTHSNYHMPILFVNLSQACENMIKYNIPGCPSLESMISFDTSNQNISGKFIKIGNDTIRTKPQVKSNWLYYAGNTNKIVCIECNADITVMQQSQQIIIQPTGFSFVDQVTNATKGQWLSYSDRYMQGCDTATISNNMQLLKDTIKYMLSGCTIKTSFNGTLSHKTHDTAWQYDNPFSTLHQSTYLKDIMHNHVSYNGNNTAGGLGPSDCIRHTCTFTDPYHNKGW